MMNGLNPFTTFDERATTWGAKEWAAQRLDVLGNKINVLSKRASTQTWQSPSNLQQFFRVEHAESPKMRDVLKPQQYQNLVRHNFVYLEDAIRDKRFLKGKRFTDISKGVLIEDNIKPIKQMAKGDFRYLGSGAIRILGLGYMGYDTARKTGDTYRSEGLEEAIKTCFKEGLKHGVVWQIAGLGFLFGKAVLPAVGKFPLGGIVAGTASAISAGMAIDKVLKK